MEDKEIFTINNLYDKSHHLLACGYTYLAPIA